MRIEIKAKGSKAFYREVVNVVLQCRKLIKNPGRKVKDMIKNVKTGLITLSVLLVAVIATMTAVRGSALLFFSLFLLIVTMLIYSVWLYHVEKTVRKMAEDKKPSVLTIDEEGVELKKETEQVVKVFWSNIAFILKLKESICFLPNDPSGMIIAISVDYKDQVMEALRETGRTDILIRGY